MSISIANKKDNVIAKDILLVIFASLFLALFAKVYIPLFFTPVPLILQNSLAISYGFFLKGKKGSIAVLLFITLGAIGLPFFSGGHFGLSWLASSTGGYILGYFFASFVVGKLFEKQKYSTKNAALIILFGHMIVLFSGWTLFSYFVGMKTAFLLGVLPFIATDVLKTIAITKLIQFNK